MAAYRYRVAVTQDHDAGGYVVTFPDFPEAVTQGDTLSEALVAAIDCVEEAMAARMSESLDLPRSARSTKHMVEPRAYLSAKAALYETARSAKIGPARLADMLDMASENEARRMLDPRHHTKLPRLEMALAALGKRLRLEVVDA